MFKMSSPTISFLNFRTACLLQFPVLQLLHTLNVSHFKWNVEPTLDSLTLVIVFLKFDRLKGVT